MPKGLIPQLRKGLHRHRVLQLRKGVPIHAATPSQDSAVAEGFPIHAATPSQGSAVAAEASRRSIGVGEHLSGEAFL